MAKKKRAPGGGRKPQGEYGRLASPFSVRMPEDLRAQLKAAAKRSRRSVGQELNSRLSKSFGRERENDRDPTIRAIVFLVSEIHDKLNWNGGVGYEWHKEPFFFKAFKLAVAKLLDELEPEGDVVQLPAIKEFIESFRERAAGSRMEKGFLEVADRMEKIWSSPSSVAAYVTERTLSALYDPPSIDNALRPWNALSNFDDEDSRELAEMGKTATERTWYGMDDVRRDLGLTKQSPMARKRKL